MSAPNPQRSTPIGAAPVSSPTTPASPADAATELRAARSLLSLRDLSRDAWEQLLAHAEQLAGPDGRRPLLAGLRFGMLLLAPSLRTRASFEVAAGDLGARALALVPGDGLWQLEHRSGVVMDGAAAEHVREAAGVLGQMVDGLGLRAFAGLADAELDRSEPVLSAFAQHCPVPVLNLESALDHPHQGLADALTVRRHVGERARVVVRWAPHIKPLPMAVPHAALLAFAREGHEVVVAHPEGYDLDAGVVADAERLARQAGGSVSVTHDRTQAQAGARIVYAKAWGSRAFYGDADASAADIGRHRDWIVTPSDLAAGDHARFMHCLPVRRGVVVDDAVLDGPASLVLDQAAARLDVQKASLCHAAGVTP